MPLQDIPLPFGEWLPDLGENNNPGLVEAKNVIARPGGYAPLRSANGNISSHVPAGYAVLGAFAYENTTPSPTPLFDYGTDVALYVGSTATAVPSTGGTRWDFCDAGNAIFAVRADFTPSSEVHLWVHAKSASTYNNTAFTGGGTDGLRASTVARVGPFLMLGACNVDTSGNVDGFSFRWSAFNDTLRWAPSQTTQAGIATVNSPSLGTIRKIVGGRNPMIMQRSGISAIRYVGPPKIWDTAEISREYGVKGASSATTYNDITYFMFREKLMMTDGVSVTALSTGRVEKYIAGVEEFVGNNSVVNVTYLAESNCILISGTDGAKTGTSGVDENLPFTEHLLFSLETGRFSRMDATTYGGIYTPSRFGKDYVIGLNSDGGQRGRADLSTGTTLAAELTTGYTTLTPGKRTSVNNVEPVYDGSGAKVAINTKATQAGAVTTGTPVAVNSLGIANMRADGRLAAVSVTFDAGANWSELKGAVVTADTSGAR